MGLSLQRGTVITVIWREENESTRMRSGDVDAELNGIRFVPAMPLWRSSPPVPGTSEQVVVTEKIRRGVFRVVPLAAREGLRQLSGPHLDEVVVVEFRESSHNEGEVVGFAGTMVCFPDRRSWTVAWPQFGERWQCRLIDRGRERTVGYLEPIRKIG